MSPDVLTSEIRTLFSMCNWFCMFQMDPTGFIGSGLVWPSCCAFPWDIFDVFFWMFSTQRSPTMTCTKKPLFGTDLRFWNHSFHRNSIEIPLLPDFKALGPMTSHDLGPSLAPQVTPVDHPNLAVRGPELFNLWRPGGLVVQRSDGKEFGHWAAWVEPGCFKVAELAELAEW